MWTILLPHRRRDGNIDPTGFVAGVCVPASDPCRLARQVKQFGGYSGESAPRLRLLATEFLHLPGKEIVQLSTVEGAMLSRPSWRWSVTPDSVGRESMRPRLEQHPSPGARRGGVCRGGMLSRPGKSRGSDCVEECRESMAPNALPKAGRSPSQQGSKDGAGRRCLAAELHHLPGKPAGVVSRVLCGDDRGVSKKVVELEERLADNAE